jgi:ABC-2 type transport system ATP-binding protein
MPCNRASLQKDIPSFKILGCNVLSYTVLYERSIMSTIPLTVEALLKVFQPRRTFPWQPAPKPFTAVDKVSFTLREGEVLGLLGPNGAGKTTITQMLLGLLTPSSGTISYFGKDFTSHRVTSRQHVTFATSYQRLPDSLTVEESIDFYARMYGISHHERRQRIKKLLDFFDMWDHRNDYAIGLSAGQTTRVMLAKAFISNPRIVLLDEPTASLDPDIARQVRAFVSEQRQQGTSILFTSHNMTEVEEICDRVLVLKNGKIVAVETPQHLARSVKSVRVNLMVGAHLPNVVTYAQQNGLSYTAAEHKIAQLLTDLARANISYDQISIEKPTLEDYFLHLSHQQRVAKKDHS